MGNTDSKSTIDSSPIFSAIMNKDRYNVNKFLSEIENIESLVDSTGHTICHYLLQYGFVTEFINLVEERGVDCYIPNKFGNKPIDSFLLSHTNNLTDFRKLEAVMEIDYSHCNMLGISVLHRLAVRSKEYGKVIKELFDTNLINFDIQNKN